MFFCHGVSLADQGYIDLLNKKLTSPNDPIMAKIRASERLRHEPLHDFLKKCIGHVCVFGIARQQAHMGGTILFSLDL